MSTATRTNMFIATRASDLKVQPSGNIGKQNLKLSLAGSSRTVLSRAETSFPAGTVKISDCGPGQLQEVSLTCPSGGLHAGDQLNTHLQAESGTEVTVVTTGANHLFAGGQITIRNRLDLAAGSIVEWIPHHSVPHSGCNVNQLSEIHVDSEASLLYWEGITSGRYAIEERFCWERIVSRTKLFSAGKLISLEGMECQTGEDRFDGANLCGSGFVVVGCQFSSASNILKTELQKALSCEPGVLGSASMLSNQIVSFRLLARNTTSAYKALDSTRAVFRSVVGLKADYRPVA